MYRFFKWAGRITAGVGLLLALLGLSGVFVHRERVRFYDNLLANAENIPAADPDAAAFMREFPAPASLKGQMSSLSTVQLVAPKAGGPIVAAVCVDPKSDEHIAVASVEQIERWSEEFWLPRWVPWVVTVFGVICGWGSDFVTWLKTRRRLAS